MNCKYEESGELLKEQQYLGEYMLSSNEIMLATGMSQSSFSRYAQKYNLKPSRVVGRRKLYHVETYERIVRQTSREYQIVELIEKKKKILKEDIQGMKEWQ